MRRLSVTVCFLALLLGALVPGPAHAGPMPTKSQWLSDVRADLTGSGGWLDRRVARGGRHLAMVLDIDNTALETYYDFGAPTPPVRRLAERGRAEGVVTLVATGRPQSRLARPARLLRRAGYHVTELCGRRRGETLAHGKERCRAHFRAEGYRLIAMVGNRPTDFTGTGYGRAWRLPNYGLRLG